MGASPSNRPPPAASGTLAKTPFLHLLIYAFEKKLGGTIEVVAPDGRTASVLFVGGEPAKARVSEPVSYLGQVLVDLGYLPAELLERTLAELADLRLETPILHGEFLVRKGLIDAVRLEAGIREQISRRLRYVAAMPTEATYAYYDGFDALHGWGGESTRGVDPLPMFWGLLRESAPRTHVEAALARVMGNSIRISKTANVVRLALGADERAAIELLRVKPLSVADFPRTAGLGEQEARLLVYLLLITKQVDVIAAGHSRSTAPPRTSLTPRITMPPRTPVPPTRTPVPPSPRTALARSLFPPGQVSRSRPPPGLAPELAERWAAIVDRARTIDKSNYFAMLDLARDATKEDANESFFALVKKWHPDRLPPELYPVKEACARVFARMSEAHTTLTDDDKRAHYMRLLDGGSGTPEMQDAVARVVEAAADFQKAEVCFKRNDLAQAEALCRKALKADATQADYHAMLGWLTSLKPENQEKPLESIHMLDKAISMNDRCEKAYFWRGMLNKRVGKPESAYRDFRKAVDLNPHNIDAAREVRLHNMRGGPKGRSSSPPGVVSRSSPLPAKPSKTDDKSGLLGRFFKK
jgi:tetratricopeptide (TPR) repeat protein